MQKVKKGPAERIEKKIRDIERGKFAASDKELKELKYKLRVLRSEEK